MSYELIAILMFSSMMLMLMTVDPNCPVSVRVGVLVHGEVFDFDDILKVDEECRTISESGAASQELQVILLCPIACLCLFGYPHVVHLA